MAKFLNNKLTVAALVAIAGAFVYFRMVGPIKETFFPPKYQASVLEEALEEESIEIMEISETSTTSSGQNLQFATAKYNLAQIDIRNLRWNESYSRNPFSASKYYRKTPLPRSTAVTRTENVNAPTLSAIVYSQQLKFAVLSGEILAVGDTFDGYRLNNIEPEHVSLMKLSNGYLHTLRVTD